MKDTTEMIVMVIGILLAIAIVFLLGGLLWWGIGSFILWAFGINFVWTFWHGLATAIILNTLGGLFEVTINKEN